LGPCLIVLFHVACINAEDRTTKKTKPSI